MAFIVKQPNGLYCRFSTITDCPTHWNMTKNDYVQLKMEEAKEEALEILENRLKPFEALKEEFTTNNMSESEFKEIIKEMHE